MPTAPRRISYQLALNTPAGRRTFTGTLDLHGRPTAEQISAAIVQRHATGGSEVVGLVLTDA